ncbi:hypothetical protein Val02_42540 [Virgisporangium aliadipatigenens]|uniref:Uncharacterized protein n=1 Tax=Virgisporangium aliadipatigenens TaxID=741659 RepID=A0A8J4DS15_9ACTN|nr:hypothetical protein Val02_42540 [Virgisporangium aliadipatigenens]
MVRAGPEDLPAVRAGPDSGGPVVPRASVVPVCPAGPVSVVGRGCPVRRSGGGRISLPDPAGCRVGRATPVVVRERAIPASAVPGSPGGAGRTRVRPATPVSVGVPVPVASPGPVRRRGPAIVPGCCRTDDPRDCPAGGPAIGSARARAHSRRRGPKAGRSDGVKA